MIDPKELRIGNCVLYKPYANQSGEQKSICGILGMKAYFNKHTNETGMIYNLQPIELTPDILKKCGFVESNDSLKLKLYEGFEFLWDGDNVCINTLVDFETIICDFKHHLTNLHRMQNLYYALTGEELIYKP